MTKLFSFPLLNIRRCLHSRFIPRRSRSQAFSPIKKRPIQKHSISYHQHSIREGRSNIKLPIKEHQLCLTGKVWSFDLEWLYYLRCTSDGREMETPGREWARPAQAEDSGSTASGGETGTFNHLFAGSHKCAAKINVFNGKHVSHM